MRALLIGLAGVWTTPALAQAAPAPAGAPRPPATAPAQMPPIPLGDGWTIRPLVEARLRYESVDQTGFARDADALTARVRAGVEIGLPHGFSLLGEAEGTLPIVEHYNSQANGRTTFPVVADGANIDLNRLQLQYRGVRNLVVTAGRQRINLDDQRFVGTVAWRQNEQTFDAVRVEAQHLGPFSIDVTYAWNVWTIFGIEAQDLPPASPVRQSIGGDNIFATAGAVFGPIQARAFAYLIDQDEPGRLGFSSQTWGLRAVATLPTGRVRTTLTGSYARQSDYVGNPNNYAADYWLLEGNATLNGFTATLGFEELGASSGGALTSFQTPLATLHRFNGWADKFLTTPPDGLRDHYVSVGRTFGPSFPLPALQASIAWHAFTSDRLVRDYGQEWNAQLGFRVDRTRFLLKYARYDADRFGADTDKFWFQIEWSL